MLTARYHDNMTLCLRGFEGQYCDHEVLNARVSVICLRLRSLSPSETDSPAEATQYESRPSIIISTPDSN